MKTDDFPDGVSTTVDAVRFLLDYVDRIEQLDDGRFRVETNNHKFVRNLTEEELRNIAADLFGRALEREAAWQAEYERRDALRQQLQEREDAGTVLISVMFAVTITVAVVAGLAVWSGESLRLVLVVGIVVICTFGFTLAVFHDRIIDWLYPLVGRNAAEAAEADKE